MESLDRDDADKQRNQTIKEGPPLWETAWRKVRPRQARTMKGNPHAKACPPMEYREARLKRLGKIMETAIWPQEQDPIQKNYKSIHA